MRNTITVVYNILPSYIDMHEIFVKKFARLIQFHRVFHFANLNYL